MSGAYGSGPASEFMVRVGLGLEAHNGYTSLSLSGDRLQINGGDIVMNWGDGTYTYPDDAGEAMEVVAEPGLITQMRIAGLGPNLVTQDAVVVTTNGDTPVPVPGLRSRINGFRNVGAEDNRVVNGNVILRQAGGGLSFSEADALNQRASQAILTVPAGRQAMVVSAIGTMAKASGAEVAITYTFFSQPSLPVRGVEVADFGLSLQRSGTTTASFDIGAPEVIGAGTNIVLRGAPSTDNQIEALVRLTLLIIDPALVRR